MAIQPDTSPLPSGEGQGVKGSNIVVAGTGVGVGTYDYTVARYNSDGSLDYDLRQRGTADVGTWTEAPVKLLVQPDGDIVLVGIERRRRQQ